jgi:putative ABC transport system permease protein
MKSGTAGGCYNVNTCWQDVRYGIRLLVKNPGFTVVAILTIAIGIGGTTSIFSIVDAVLLQPLPYAQADQLLLLSGTDKERGLAGISVSFTRMQRILQNTRSFSSVAGYFPSTVSFKQTEAVPDEISSTQVSSEFFNILRVSPILGREFLPQEDSQGGAAVALVSNRFWHERFGGDPSLIGRSLTLDGRATAIVGILPANFRFPFVQPEPDIWLPRVFDNPTLGPVKVNSGAGFLQVIARTRSGVSLDAVKSDLRSIDLSYKHDFPAFADSQEDTAATPLKEGLVGQIRQPLLVLMAATAGVLLIGCTNLMNLLLARANGRTREIAIRMAIGAGRRRLVRQLLTEATLLSVAGASIGLLLALLGKSFLRFLPPGTLPRSDEVSLNGEVILFCICLAILSAVFFGLVPSLRASGKNIHDGLKEGNRSATSGHRASRARATLVAAEVALTMLLLSGSAVLIKSLARLMHVDPGFDANSVLTMSLNLPAQRYSPDQQKLFIRRLLDSVNTLPKVHATGAVNALPLVNVSPFMYFCPEGWTCKGIGKDPLSSMREVTPDYFRSMGIPLLRGRSFNDHDDVSGQPVAIINQTAAERFFHGSDPIGKWIANSRDMKRLMIVGLVKDVRFLGLNTPAFQEIYMPHQQSGLMFPNMSLVVRSDSADQALLDAVRKKVADIDPDVAVTNISSMNDLVSTSIAQPRLTTAIGFLFAFLAVVLTVIGIYGVLAYSVSQQTHEIGIRMALGATPRRVVNLVLNEGMRIVALGLLVGVMASLTLTRLLQSLLFGTSPRDPITLLCTVSVIAVVAFFACFIPAVRASRIRPSIALQVQ